MYNYDYHLNAGPREEKMVVGTLALERVKKIDHSHSLVQDSGFFDEKSVAKDHSKVTSWVTVKELVTLD